MMDTLASIWRELIAFDMPVPDFVWGGSLVLIIIWLFMRNAHATAGGSTDAIAREYERANRALRDSKRELERERTKIRRQRRDSRSF
ncbi:MAG: hypothetical protein AAF367_09540 [Pseudomonadota bacterium]